jgi:hypothetical protein
MQANASTRPALIDRRTFVKAASTAALGLAVGGAGLRATAGSNTAASITTAAPRRRYAIVGCGNRHRMLFNAILKKHRHVAELVAVCDMNEGRAKNAQKLAAAAGAQMTPKNAPAKKSASPSTTATPRRAPR